MHRHLILRLEAPLMAFGGTMIDAIGPTRELPILSMITGLIANALGWQRGDRDKHQELQDRLIIGARLDRAGTELFDFQTAQLAANDKGWTTRGVIEERAGGAATYKSPHIRKRFFRADAFVTVALRLAPAAASPDLDVIAAALVTPARPLFIGRKPCLPARPVHAGEAVDATTVFDALLATTIVAGQPRPHWRKDDPPDNVRMVVPPNERQPTGNDRIETVSNVRDWVAGVHAGENRLVLLSRPRTDFPPWPPGAL